MLGKAKASQIKQSCRCFFLFKLCGFGWEHLKISPRRAGDRAYSESVHIFSIWPMLCLAVVVDIAWLLLTMRGSLPWCLSPPSITHFPSVSRNPNFSMPNFQYFHISIFRVWGFTWFWSAHSARRRCWGHVGHRQRHSFTLCQVASGQQILSWDHL